MGSYFKALLLLIVLVVLVTFGIPLSWEYLSG
jgi:hypothetical protein